MLCELNHTSIWIRINLQFRIKTKKQDPDPNPNQNVSDPLCTLQNIIKGKTLPACVFHEQFSFSCQHSYCYSDQVLPVAKVSPTAQPADQPRGHRSAVMTRLHILEQNIIEQNVYFHNLYCDKSICRPGKIPCNSWEHYKLQQGYICQHQFPAIAWNFPSYGWELSQLFIVYKYNIVLIEKKYFIIMNKFNNKFINKT